MLWRYNLNLKSKEKLFEELGLEFLQHKWWFKKLCSFYKILKEQSLKCLFDKLTRPSYPISNASNIHHFKVKHSFFKKRFFRQSSLNGIYWTKFHKGNKLKYKFYKNKSCNTCMCSKKLACYFDNNALKFFFTKKLGRRFK